MEILQLRYFCDAAGTENFSKTAKKFYVPTSNISQCIKRLENEVGESLFIRQSNRVVLTQKGREFYETIQQSLSEIDEAVIKLKDNEEKIEGNIKVGIYTNRRIVTKAIEHFKQKYPEVTFNINHINTDLGNNDIVISDNIAHEELYNKSLLISENFILVMNKKNSLSLKDNISANDLKHQQFITMNDNSSLFKSTINICSQMGFSPNISIQTDDPYYVRKYVELNLGVAFVPEISWKGLFSDNTVFKKTINHIRNTYVFVKKYKYVSMAMRMFIDELNYFVSAPILVKMD